MNNLNYKKKSRQVLEKNSRRDFSQRNGKIHPYNLIHNAAKGVEMCHINLCD
jgi:hypothetical protein